MFFLDKKKDQMSISMHLLYNITVFQDEHVHELNDFIFIILTCKFKYQYQSKDNRLTLRHPGISVFK